MEIVDTHPRNPSRHTERSLHRWVPRGLARAASAGLLVLLAGPVAAQTRTHGLTIPAGDWKPIWSNTARLAAAQARFSRNRAAFSRVGQGLCNDAPCRSLYEAFVYVMTGRFTAANGGVVDTTGDALAWAVDADWYCDKPGGCTNDQQPDNEARWWGESHILVYAWLRGEMTAEQRVRVIGTINTAVAKDLAKTWGGPADVANNYHWGYTRNALLWGMVSYHEPHTHAFSHSTLGCVPRLCGRAQRQIAEDFLDEALNERWRNLVQRYFQGAGRMGSMAEGSQYGPYLLDYYLVAMITAEDLGRPLIDEGTYYLPAVYAVIYATTSRPTHACVPACADSDRTGFPRYQLFSFGDAEQNDGYPVVHRVEYGHFMTWAAVRWEGTPAGEWARHWLHRTAPLTHPHIKVLDPAPEARGRPFDALPLDFYTAGNGNFYLRDSWSDARADRPVQLLWQLSRADGSHAHCDAGTFQIVRGEYWLAKEAPGRSVTYADREGGPGVELDSSIWSGSGVTVNDSDYDGVGQCSGRKAAPLRLESRADYAFAAVDLTGFARIAGTTALIREFYYFRALNAMVTFDRITTTNPDARRTALIHTPQPPLRAGTVFTAAHRAEQLRTIDLSGSIAGQTVAYSVVDTGAAGTGHPATREPTRRLQIDVKGAATAYIAVAMQIGSIHDPHMTAQLAEDDATVRITLAKTGTEPVVLALNKGAGSAGGTVKIGNGAAAPLTARMSALAATVDGPAWELEQP